MNWYLLYSKPKQEKFALDNLQRQGYECYLPTIPCEKLRQGLITVLDEPLFPRYLFIRLGRESSAKSWAPIRSTKGVSRLVRFGIEPVRVDDFLIELLRTKEALVQTEPMRLFKPGERISLTEAPFSGIDGVFQEADGERRVIVLIELLSKPVAVHVAPSSLRKAN
jgi:transcriptional antiterminator RfaH